MGLNNLSNPIRWLLPAATIIAETIRSVSGSVSVR
jgi:hypothetical protein